MRPRWSGAFIRFHAPLAFPSPCQPHARIWGHHTAGLSHCHPLAEAVEQQRGRRPDSSTDQVPSILEQRLRCEQIPPGGPPYLLGPTCNTVTLELMFLGCGRHLGTLAEGIPGKETRANDALSKPKVLLAVCAWDRTSLSEWVTEAPRRGYKA